MPFDNDRLKIAGAPVPVLEGVVTESYTEAPNFAISATGRLVYISGESAIAPPRRLLRVDRQGREEHLSAPSRSYEVVRISPDGQRAALEIDNEGEGEGIWIWDFSRETLAPLDTGRMAHQPEWTRDSLRVLFQANGPEHHAYLYEKAADGSGPAQKLSDEFLLAPYSASPDGKSLVYREMLRSGDDLYALSLETLERHALLQSESDERNGELSPDGRWLAYESNESGTFEIYVRPFPAVEEGKWAISSGGGTRPLWSRDGRELFYQGVGALMAVAVEATGDDFRPGRATRLFERRFPTQAGKERLYDVSLDGQRFLMLEDVEPGGSEPRFDVVLVDNWSEELKRLVPATD